MSETPDLDAVRHWLKDLQRRLGAALAEEDGGDGFRADDWERPGGGGRTCILENGPVLEKAGIGFSEVQGETLPPSASATRPEVAGRRWRAMGVSLVVHPRNPYAPTSHANLRLFVAEADDAPPIWWFGGGFDLSPCFGFDEDCIHWHRTARDACTPYGAHLYPRFKRACDEYFFLRHRGEPRGIGGLFFDDHTEGGFQQSFALARSVGAAYLHAYRPILARRKHLPYGEQQRAFQLYRRGRYVEFNLVQDRGTIFGLQSGGRTESILMSLPPLVSWEYGRHPAPGSAEARLHERYLVPHDWADGTP